jgi:hypothetical protein
MTTAPFPLDQARREPRTWLKARPLWTSISIVAMWAAVAVTAAVGPDLVSRSGYGANESIVPSVFLIALLAAVATIFVARYGFAPERHDD